MVRVILICAAARSGSTLLDMLLGSHSRIESLGEINFLGKAIVRGEACSCGSPVSACKEWQRVFDAVKKERGVDLLQQPYALRQWDTKIEVVHADPQQQTRAYLVRRKIRMLCALLHFQTVIKAVVPLPPELSTGLENTFYFYGLIRRIRNVDTVVDSSKDILKSLSVYQHDPEGTRIVLLTRDGRGVMYSRLHSGVRTGESARYAVGQWRKYYGRATRLINHWVAPDHLFRLKYEELAAAPEQVMLTLMQWLGAEFTTETLVSGAKPLHLVGGNEGTKTGFRHGVQTDERWRKGLSTEELELFSRLAGPLNTTLGYVS